MLRIRASNFRVLKQVDWTPAGLCLLIGPNGAGKTTLLRLLHFLRIGASQSINNAIMSMVGGPVGLLHLSAIHEQPLVTIEVSDSKAIWRIILDGTKYGNSNFPPSGEYIEINGQTIAKRSLGDTVTHFDSQQRMDENRSSIKLLMDVLNPEELVNFAKKLDAISVYPPVAPLSRWAREGTFNATQGTDLELSKRYNNAFTVLRNWRDSRKLRNQFDYVMMHLRNIYPNDFYELDFLPATSVLRPGANVSLPIENMSDGFLAALMHLTAAAGMKEGGLLAIDQIEDSLHPAAIRGIIEALKFWIKERNLTIILTTHSPYVMDLFDSTPEQVYVMEPGYKILPVRLTDIHDSQWLAHFKIGSLYGVEFAKQARVTNLDDQV